MVSVVEQAPVFTLPLHDVRMQLGAVLRLKANVHATPQPHVQWTCNGQILDR
jgi:hypothetical protein